MGQETEVFKLDLDTTALEAKAARVQQLFAEIKQGKDRGEDVSKLEKQLHAELDGLMKVGKQEKKTADATGDLIKQKEKLGAVVRSLGGNFSGLIGDIGGVVELLLQSGPAGAAAAAGMAGIAAVVGLYRSFNEELERAIELTKKLEAAQDEFTQQQVEPIEQITAALQQFGAFSQKNLKGAYDLYVDTRGEGVGKQRAAELASIGFLGHISPGQVARIAAAGLRPETADEAVAQTEELVMDAAAKAELDATIERNKRSRVGAQSILEATAIRDRMKVDRRFLEKLTGVSQDVVLQERAKEMGLIKPEADLGRIDELRKEYAELQRRAEQDPSMYAAGHPAYQPLSKSERMRLDVLKPLAAYGRRLTEQGIPDDTGPVTDTEPPNAADRWASWASKPEPRGFTEHTRTVINNFFTQNNGAVTVANLPLTGRCGIGTVAGKNGYATPLGGG